MTFPCWYDGVRIARPSTSLGAQAEESTSQGALTCALFNGIRSAYEWPPRNSSLRRKTIFGCSVLPAWCSPNFDPGWREASPEARRSVFGDYIDAASAAGVERFDVVLVDGRCRGECALAVLPFVDERSFVSTLHLDPEPCVCPS